MLADVNEVRQVPLVEAARGGSPRATAALVEEYLPLVHDLVRRRLGDDADVEDVVQDVMLRVVRGLPDLQDPGAFRPWLISITVRQARDHLRVTGHRDAGRIDWEAVADAPDPAQDFIGHTVTGIELTRQRAEAARAVALLSGDERELVALWWQEAAGAITRTELAAALGRPLPHTAVRVQRVKARLDVARVAVRALAPRNGCPELRALVGRARRGGRRAAVVRHVRGCGRCAELGRGLVPLDGLLAGFLLPLPVGLAGRTLDAVAPELARTALTAGSAAKPLAVLGGVAAAVTVAGAAAVYYLPLLPTPPAPTPTRTPTPTVRSVTYGVTSGDVWVAPGGDDSGPGSAARPFATLTKAVAAVRPGQTIAVRGGRYRVTAPVRIQTSGTPGARITLSNVRGERPVFDLSGLTGPVGFIEQRADRWTVEGLELTGGRLSPYICFSCSDNEFRHLSVHDGNGFGFVLRGDGTNGNAIRDSDFFRNHDDDQHGANADGLLIAYGSGTSNLVTGCRFSDNADDGLDVVRFDGSVRIERNWSWGNGVNRWGLTGFAGSGHGFRLGAGPHRVVGNAAWRNAGEGFDQGVNPTRVTLQGNTAYGNGAAGFAFDRVAAASGANVGEANAGSDRIGARPSTPLVTADEAVAEGPRDPSGSLPATAFLTAGISPPSHE